MQIKIYSLPLRGKNLAPRLTFRFLIMSNDEEKLTKKEKRLLVFAIIVGIAVPTIMALFPILFLGAGIFVGFIISIIREICNGNPIK